MTSVHAITSLLTIVLPLAFAIVPGWAILWVILPHGIMPGNGASPTPRSMRAAEWLMRVAIAWVLGVAVFSIVQFAAMMLFDGRHAAVFAMDAAVGVAGLAVIIRNRARAGRARASTAASPPAAAAFRRDPRVSLLIAALALATVSALLYTAGAACGQVMTQPHGAWDAWMIWNSKARVFFLAGANWTQEFVPEAGYAHPDYPLLVPLSIARLWTYASQPTLMAPIIFAMSVAIALLLLLFGAMWRLRDVSQGLLAVLAVLAPLRLTDNLSMQLADVPLSLFVLAAFVANSIALREGGEAIGARVLTGLCLGAAAWTKNEGILFAAAFCITATLFRARATGVRAAIKGLVVVLLGATALFLCILVHKLINFGSTDLFRNRSLGEIVQLAIDFKRHWIIIKSTRLLIEMNIGASTAIAAVVFVIAAAVVRGCRVPCEEFTGAVAIALVSLGYYMIYLLTPHDIVWHIGTSMVRLMWQLWPAGVFSVLLILPSPAELLSTATGRTNLAI